MYCPKCGIELPKHAKFCRSCGNALAAPIPADQPNADAESGPKTLATTVFETPTASIERTALPSHLNPRPRRPRLVVGIGIVALVAAAVAIIFWYAHSPDATAPSAGTVASASANGTQQSDLLDQRAGSCPDAKGSGASVGFANTRIPTGLDADHAGLCKLAHEAAERQARTTRQTLTDLCESVAPNLLQLYGTGDFSAIERHLHETGADTSPSAQQAVAVVSNCAHQDAAIQTTLLNIPQRIYSVGQVSVKGLSCVAYLLETSGMRNSGGTTTYELYGAGPCADRDFRNKSIFHPVANPTGRPPGDVFRSEYAYTGPMPKQWVYKGQYYTYSGEPNNAAETAGPSTPEIPAAPPGPGSASAGQSFASATLDSVQQAANGGDPDAQTELGVRLQKGKELTKDDARAAQLFQAAAAKGNPRALTNLGWIYTLGQGIPRDDLRAVDLFRQAADQGYPNAQDSLGWMYQHGRGVAQDDSTAITWYRKAADQGFEKSKQNLAALDSKRT